MRGAFKNTRSFLFSFFSLLLEWCQGTKARRAALSGCSARDQPCSGASIAGRAPHFPNPLSPSPCLIPKCSVLSSVTPACSALRDGQACSVVTLVKNMSLKWTWASLQARWHKIRNIKPTTISHQNESDLEQRILFTLGYCIRMRNCFLEEYTHILYLHTPVRLPVLST